MFAQGNVLDCLLAPELTNHTILLFLLNGDTFQLVCFAEIKRIAKLTVQ